METIQTLCGTFIPVDKILEVRPAGDGSMVMTLSRNYRVSVDFVLSLIISAFTSFTPSGNGCSEK